MASQLLEQQQSCFLDCSYKVLSIELAAGLGHTFHDNKKRTIKLSILIKRLSTISLLGYRSRWNLSIPMALLPSWKQTGFDYDGAIALIWNGKTYVKKVYREAEGLRLESHQPDYDDLVAP